MLKPSASPHLRRIERPYYQAGGVLLCLFPLVVFSCLYYGVRPLLLVLIGLVTAVLTEALCALFAHHRPSLNDGTSAVTGALIGCMMSPLTPFWVPIMGSLFAIGVVKMPFGGTGRNVFNPAAAGLAFCTICFPTRLFTYPDPALNTSLPLVDTASVVTTLSPAAQLSHNATTSVDWLSLITGNFAGPIGSAGVIILLACALYLWMRGSSSLLITTPYVATCALLAWCFPRSSSPTAVLTELCTGLLLFTGVFLLCDPVTAPRHWLARVCYGVLAAILVMSLRHFGRFECCEFFAVLLVNAFAPVLDRTCWRLADALSEVMNR
ncbi:MAG: RnfABCDGE type electron transport complex subunit D [Clostridia bacterium]|nr:RnfABCDGE type electron transport complex subunit D [Clostridia bacterium]